MIIFIILSQNCKINLDNILDIFIILMQYVTLLNEFILCTNYTKINSIS